MRQDNDFANKDTKQCYEVFPDNQCYIAKHNCENVRINSRSGGVFTALSDNILDIGGVIYGCAMDSVYHAAHQRALDNRERDTFCGSKYIQSEMGNCFVNVKQDLEAGKTVLFSGTGCQVAGLKLYLESLIIDASRLFTVDIICHGVPSPMLWKSYLEWMEKRHEGTVQSIVFREKKQYGWASHFEVVEIDNTKYVSSVFAQLFLKNYILRPSCYECPYASIKHPADITLGDAWGLNRNNPDWYDDKGCSLVILNSNKGEKLFFSASKNVDYKEVDINDYLQLNLKYPSKKPDDREEFWKCFQEMGFNKLVEKYVSNSNNECNIL